MTERPSLILPVEVQSRELDAKLLLGCVAARRGFRVFLGCRWRLLGQLHRLPPSVYIAKDVSERTFRIYDLLARLGHAAMAWDEEALVYMNPDIYRRLKVSARSLASPRVLLAWGEDNADIWRGTDGYAGQPVPAVGNPRADMLHPFLRGYWADQVAELRTRYGRFVLINSNFGWINNKKADVREERLRLVGTSDPALPQDRIGTWQDPAMLTYRYEMFQAFLTMLPEIARRFPGRRFVLRPHPSEDQDAWRRAAAGCDNIEIVHEGNIVPWLLAADAVVQNGCTTGVESFLLGRPLIAYQPMTHPVYDMRLPNVLGLPANDLGDLAGVLDAVAQGADNPLHDSGRQALAARFIATSDESLAAERIVDTIADAAQAVPLFERRPVSERAGAWLEGAVRAGKRALRLSGSHRSGHDVYVQHIFPDTSAAQVQARIERLRTASDRIGTTEAIERGANLFELRAA